MDKSTAQAIHDAFEDLRRKTAAAPRCYLCERRAEVKRPSGIWLCAECAEPIPVP